jgi:hypothetical protein
MIERFYDYKGGTGQGVKATLLRDLAYTNLNRHSVIVNDILIKGLEVEKMKPSFEVYFERITPNFRKELLSVQQDSRTQRKVPFSSIYDTLVKDHV